jgi:predicted nucleic acid-binding protein
MLVELAVAGRAEFIITSNVRHFGPASQFSVRVVTPREFVAMLRDS